MDAVKALARLESIILPHVDPAWWDGRSSLVKDLIKNGKIRIAFVGQFNAGKSTLLNALIAEDLLPHDVVPTTPVVSEIEEGDDSEFFEVEGHEVFEGGEETTISREQFRTLASNRTTSKGRIYLRARVSRTSFSPDVVLVDTPGVDSLEKAHTEITYGYLGRADAVVLVTDGTRGSLQEPQIRFLRDHILRRTRERLVVVVTHLDNKTEDEAGAVMRHIKEQIAGEVMLPDAPVLRVDAAPAMNIRLSGDESDDAGLQDLVATLDRMLTEASGKMRSERAVRSLCTIARESERLLATNRDALDAEREDLEAKVRDWTDKRKLLREKRDAVERRLDSGVNRLTLEMRPQVQRLLQAVADNAPQYVRELESSGEDHERVSSKIQGDLARELEVLASDWLRPALEALVEDVGKELQDLAVEIPELALPKPDVPGEIVLDILIEGGLLLLLNVILPGEWLVALVARVLGKRGLEKLTEPVRRALMQVVKMLLGGIIRGRMEAAIRGSVLSLDNDLLRAVEGEVSEIKMRVKRLVFDRFDADLAELIKGAESALEEKEANDREISMKKARFESALKEIQALSIQMSCGQ